MNQNYFAVTVKTRRQAIEAVEFALLEAGAEGTELDLLGKKQTEEDIRIVGYFSAQPDKEFIHGWLAIALEIYELPAETINSLEINEVENRDWLAEWKKHWQPTETNKFIVAPSWFELSERGDKIVLRIEPGMAFGTGTHETTRLCLQAIEENYEPEMSFFDVGTGTGVLAIAAAKIKSKAQSPTPKAQKIFACDTDADSVKIAIENAEINNVGEKIKFYTGSIDEDTPQFDFIAANLTADVIVPLLPQLSQKFNKTLILSGILREQQEWVARELGKLQMENTQIQTDGEWISVLIQKSNA
ncbi:MAG: 50S ribosomal protein L11 methyltransferase [Pyrinomonadaceae bacterium]